MVCQVLIVHLLLTTKKALPPHVIAQGGNKGTFAAIANATMGSSGIYLVDISLIITLLVGQLQLLRIVLHIFSCFVAARVQGATAVYVLTVGQLMHQVVPGLGATTFVLLVVASVLLPLSFAGDLSFLAWVLSCFHSSFWLRC